MTTTAGPFAKFANVLQQEGPGKTPLGLQVLTIFGAEGTGKSTVAAGFPNHMYLDLESSAVELDINRLALPRTWAAFKEFVTAIHDAAKSPFDGKTLIIDPVTDLWELCVKHGLAERRMKDMPDDYGRTLNAIRQDFKATMGMLLNLRTSQRLGTVLVCHEESEEIKLPTATFHVFRPKVNDKDIKGWVAAKPQMVLRCSKEDVHPVTGQPWPAGTTVPRYLIRTNPLSAADVVKDRTKRLPPFVSTSYEALEAAYNNNTKPEGE